MGKSRSEMDVTKATGGGSASKTVGPTQSRKQTSASKPDHHRHVRLRRLRREVLRWTVDTAAARAGVSDSLIWTMENRPKGAAEKTLDKYERVLKRAIRERKARMRSAKKPPRPTCALCGAYRTQKGGECPNGCDIP